MPVLGPGARERVEEYAQRSKVQFRGNFREMSRREEPDEEEGETSQKIRRVGADYSVELAFRNFNQDALKIAVKIPERDVRAAVEEFGFRDRDFKELDEWYRKAQEGAIARTKELFYSGKVTAPNAAALERKLAEIKKRNADIQANLDIILSDLAKEYRQRRTKLYTDAGFRYKDERTVEVDMPALARRNARRMAAVSLAFSGIVEEHEYGMEELAGAVTAMAQTSLRYEIPASREGERTIGGVMPPPKAFTLGQGDCDTKTGLMGSILLNWPNLRLVGLAIPGHYLLAIHRIPSRGEFFVEHDGLPYVMIEPAGPAWLPPGKVGDQTEQYLKSGKLFAIQPFTLGG